MSGGIGAFIIGEGALGSSPFDYAPTIISQYANSPTILTLIEDFAECVDPTIDINNFFDTIFNVLTAVGFGLDIWGRIVGVGRVFPIDAAIYLGFEGGSGVGFGQGIWYGGPGNTSNFSLSDDAYRSLILTKAMSNITDGSIPSLNMILQALFAGRGNAYVIDNEDMTMTYRFQFELTPVDRTIVNNSGVLPNPTGVAVNVVSG